MFGIQPPGNSAWTHVEPVQVDMRGRWDSVDGARCMRHINLRREIRVAFTAITAQFGRVGGSETAQQRAILGTVLQDDERLSCYERPHAKMFAEYVIMQLCGSMGQAPSACALARDAIGEAEAVLTSCALTLRAG